MDKSYLVVPLVQSNGKFVIIEHPYLLLLGFEQVQDSVGGAKGGNVVVDHGRQGKEDLVKEASD